MRWTPSRPFAWVVIAVALGCSGTEASDTPKCVPGSTAACLCTDGSSGVQTCNGDGTFAACVCTGSDAGADTADATIPDDAVGSDAALDTSVVDSGVVDSGVDGVTVDSAGDSGADSPADGDADATPAGPMASCATPGDGRTNCGGSGTESCCTSLVVTGVAAPTFSRSYDGLSTGYTDAKYKAQVSSFRLDKYEVTVGRFRMYVAAVLAGWRPKAGAGKHTHLYSGNGLAGPGFGMYEPGWSSDWNTPTNFPTTAAAWDTNLLGSGHTTWTPSPGANEKRPINYVSWYDAAAFCIWDGGFLPSEAEWNYAAAGGMDQRAYPWSAAYPPGSTTITNAHATYCGLSCGTGPMAVGAHSPLGDGKWGHADLAGNVAEWTIDFWKTTYNETSCVDCAYTYAPGEYQRIIRGGSFGSDEIPVLASFRYGLNPITHQERMGIRCARTP